MALPAVTGTLGGSASAAASIWVSLPALLVTLTVLALVTITMSRGRRRGARRFAPWLPTLLTVCAGVLAEHSIIAKPLAVSAELLPGGVQSPKAGKFTHADLSFFKGKAHIPLTRLRDFLEGEALIGDGLRCQEQTKLTYAEVASLLTGRPPDEVKRPKQEPEQGHGEAGSVVDNSPGGSSDGEGDEVDGGVEDGVRRRHTGEKGLEVEAGMVEGCGVPVEGTAERKHRRVGLQSRSGQVTIYHLSVTCPYNSTSQQQQDSSSTERSAVGIRRAQAAGCTNIRVGTTLQGRGIKVTRGHGLPSPYHGSPYLKYSHLLTTRLLQVLF